MVSEPPQHKTISRDGHSFERPWKIPLEYVSFVIESLIDMFLMKKHGELSAQAKHIVLNDSFLHREEGRGYSIDGYCSVVL